MFNEFYNEIVMARAAFVLLIVASIWLCLVTSLKQIKQKNRSLRKAAIFNPYHQDDESLSDILDFSKEDNDYLAERYGRLSEEETTTIVYKDLKINGRYSGVGKPHEIKYYNFRIDRRKNH